MESAQRLAYDFSGPVLFDYVWWILTEAIRRKIKRLYFLARDGYLLKLIAEEFCLKFSLPIECRYLYCSRYSLRIPSYHLIGDEALSLLTLGGYDVTLRSIMARAGLDNDQVVSVLTDCKLSDLPMENQLSRIEHREIFKRLRASEVFRAIVTANSIGAYPTAIGYLKQEGLLSSKEIAIVDSGWSGSIQRSLRQLLESGGKHINIIGFYFGLYNKVRSEDGTYLTWYFDDNNGLIRKVLFCNNLFECMLSAPHGMTIGYKKEKECFVPVLKPSLNDNIQDVIQNHIQEIEKFVKNRLCDISFFNMPRESCIHETAHKIKRYMVYPKPDEVEVYGNYLFCDDVAEQSGVRLSGIREIQDIRKCSILHRVVIRYSNSKTIPALFWPYGAIAYLPHYLQIWYRMNFFIWEAVRIACNKC